MKVFISQPMRGLSDEEIKNNRERAILEIKSKYDNVEILDSFFGDYNGNAVQFLGKSILLLGEADLAVFLPGWSQARGCRMEEMVANTYEIKCLFL